MTDPLTILGAVLGFPAAVGGLIYVAAKLEDSIPEEPTRSDEDLARQR